MYGEKLEYLFLKFLNEFVNFSSQFQTLSQKLNVCNFREIKINVLLFLFPSFLLFSSTISFNDYNFIRNKEI